MASLAPLRSGMANPATIAMLCTAAWACIFDEDDPCGPYQEEIDKDYSGCVCASGAVPNDDGIGCRPCGDNEEVRGQACVCASGYVRPDGQESCRPMDDARLDDEDAGTTSNQETDGPSGQNMPCSTQADCAGFDASHCETLQERVCLVPGCAVGDSECASGRECCDLSAVPIAELTEAGGLCVPTGSCVTPGVVVSP